jgi:hypothetical protein
MSTDAIRELVIAIDYYDGEVEGFARLACGCRYFKRTREGDVVHDYVSVEMTEDEFSQLVSLLEYGPDIEGFRLYAGNIERAEPYIHFLLGRYVPLLSSAGNASKGRSYAKSMERFAQHTPMDSMHDWLLVSVTVDWGDGQARILVEDPSSARQEVLAEELLDIAINRVQPWGPSEWINEVRGPTVADDGTETLEIETQAGEVLKFRARLIVMPATPTDDRV